MDSPEKVETETPDNFRLQIRLVVFQSIPDGPDMHKVITVIPKQYLQQPGVVV